MSQREQPAFPRRMTEYDAAPGYRDAKSWAAAGVVSTGLELSHQLVRYLDYSMTKQTVDDRLEQLEAVDEDAAKAYRMRKRGIPAEEIAVTMGCSRATVYRVLAWAHQWVQPALDEEEASARTPEQRLELLRQRHPRAFQVYLLCGHGWSQERVSEMLDVADRTVRRDVALARDFVGEIDRRLLRRYREEEIKAA